MPDAYRRRRLFVAATAVLVTVLVAAFAWAISSRPDRPSTPRWVVQSAQRAGDEFSVTPAELMFASKGTLGWGVVMKGDFACRGCVSQGRYLGVRLSPPGAKARTIGVCETLSPCRRNVTLDRSESLASPCGQALLEDWYVDGRVDRKYTRRCFEDAHASPLAGARLQSCAKQVIEDWYSDGRVSKLYPLACYAGAIDLVPVRDFSPPREDIQRALEFARRGKLAPSAPGRGGVFFVTKGMTKRQVRALAGNPYRAGPLCWLYHATDAAQPNVTGMRICFADGHVSTTQTSVHG
jgi:hypothetical protein